MLISQGSGDSAYDIAMAYAYRNDRDQAFVWLDRAYEQKDVNLAEFLGESLFKNLRSDARYKAFLRKMHLPD